MPITLSEAIISLTTGTPLTWKASGAYKAGSIQLGTAGTRRLARFLIEANPDLVASADESLFDDIMAAWTDEEADPASGRETTPASASTGPWRLKHIETAGFGGLTTPGGPAFELDVGGENWCLEGYNGSGKTSLASLILWTMTGYCNREQDGPVRDDGHREAVTNSSGKAIGTWPPLVTYPFEPAGLKADAMVTACLTFVDPAGDTATAKRKIISPVEGDAAVEVDIDPRLLVSPELIESGLLMPARITHIGFGSKSQSLYQALKMLTGLDHLASVASGAGNLSHAGKRFLKYAKDQGIETHAQIFANSLERARGLAADRPIDLSKVYELGGEGLIDDLTELETDATTKAGAALDILKTEISTSLDVNNERDRELLNSSVNTARVYLSEGTKGISLFKSFAALKKAGDEGLKAVIDQALTDAGTSLTEALEWHAKQENDKKLRLKALASKFFIPESALGEAASCPVCNTKLTTEEQKALAAELTTLQGQADKAERAISDACRDIDRSIQSHIPDYLKPLVKPLAGMDPAASFAAALKERFADNSPFSDHLTGIGTFTETYAAACETSLPSFTHTSLSFEQSAIADVQILQTLMIEIGRVAALADWWSANKGYFASAWNKLVGIEDAEGNWPTDSLEGKLQTLEDAIAGSDPLDKIAKLMAKAKKAAGDWQVIQNVQKVREAIAEAVKPLKELQLLIDCETHRTIETLSGRVSKILDEIRLKDRFSYENAAMAKKTVSVEGSFTPGLKIDAALVANSSWLRALLWAFIFALREQTIADTGSNAFPLMVLDDPQTSFDPKNKRKWCEKIVGGANLDTSNPKGMQLFLATHERQFYDIICETCELDGQQAKMAGLTKTSQVAHIVNGTFLERQFAKSSADEDDEEGYRYIQQVRIYCEDLLKIMLRPESYEIGGDTLGKLCELMSKLRADHVAPYNRSVFQNLIKVLNEKEKPEIKIINASHHTYDGTIGYAQAQDVQKYWEKSLQKAFVNAFRAAADYDAYGGISRLFAWKDNVAEFPAGHKDKIKALAFISTGVAAAALSDGRIGDGQIEIEEWSEARPITLFNHSAYRLNAGTLDPVAGIGDIILVQDFGTPRSRNLTVVAFGDKLYARRLNETEDHPDVIMLTGQATDPYALPEPVIALKDKVKASKIVGTIFMSQTTPPPNVDGNEVCAVDDFALIKARLKGVKLFEVRGRSMEPVALEGQFVMTLEETLDQATLKRLSGDLVIAVDQHGGVYFKRLRQHGKLVVLESANSSVTTSSEILSLDDGLGYPQLVSLKSVVGVLFDLPYTNGPQI